MKDLKYPEWQTYHDDRLVIRWRNTVTRKHVYQGKRVGRNCPLDRHLRRLYVKGGSVAVVKELMHTRGMRISDAMDLLNQARGPVRAKDWFYKE